MVFDWWYLYPQSWPAHGDVKCVVDKPRETPEPMTETDITNRLNPFCKYLDPSILDVVYINDDIKFEDLTMGYVYATIFLRGQ